MLIHPLCVVWQHVAVVLALASRVVALALTLVMTLLTSLVVRKCGRSVTTAGGEIERTAREADSSSREHSDGDGRVDVSVTHRAGAVDRRAVRQSERQRHLDTPVVHTQCCCSDYGEMPHRHMLPLVSHFVYIDRWTIMSRCVPLKSDLHTHPFNGALSRITRMSRYQKGKTNLDFTEARDSEWQWHQLSHMQVCISLQTDNHASITPLSFFTGRMPFLPPNQQRQSTEGNSDLTRGKSGPH